MIELNLMTKVGSTARMKVEAQFHSLYQCLEIILSVYHQQLQVQFQAGARMMLGADSRTEETANINMIHERACDYLDSMLIPLSLLVMLGYHAYLWHHLNLNPRLTTIGVHSIRRRQWLLQLQRGDDKKRMLAIQSLRNTLMTTIFTATVTILLTLALAALANNAYNASTRVFTSSIFGSQSGRMMGLKYGSASAMLLGSFFCSSLATGLLIDSNYLVLNSWEWMSALEVHMPTEQMLERGYGLAVVGNRMLCVGLATSLWLLGPAPVAVASLALVWGLYHLDFPVPTNLTITY